MNRLETSERQFYETVSRVEGELLRSAKARAELSKSIELIEKIENRAETALRQLRDVIRQSEGA